MGDRSGGTVQNVSFSAPSPPSRQEPRWVEGGPLIQEPEPGDVDGQTPVRGLRHQRWGHGGRAADGGVRNQGVGLDTVLNTGTRLMVGKPNDGSWK